ncbi:baseplate hub protein [Acetobacter fabarum]|uniref:baseplate hub protein n=1 Tax=Acetobacter fabarum TaxID=483199 RepID=UPI0039EBA047
MSDSSFVKRKIDVVFNIVQGGFDGSNNEQITLTGHRVSCQILSAGMETGVMCALRIEGMQLSQMNQLSVVQSSVVSQSQNTVTVLAGNEGDALSAVFSGGIIEGFVDYSGAPNVAFEVRALSTAIPDTMPITTTSFNAGASVATIMESIAGKIGLKFQNHGVDSVLAGPVYYCHSALEQMNACAQAAGIYYIISMNVLHIWPKAFVVDTGGAIEVSSDNGLIGYPNYSQGGVGLQCLFNPSIGFRSTIKLKSQYSPAAWVNDSGQLNSLAGGSIYPPSNGLWIVQRMQHDLQSEEPNGVWLTTIEAARPEMYGSVYFGR